MFKVEKNKLIVNDRFGKMWIEGWGKNSVRVRMTANRTMDKNDWALENDPDCPSLVTGSTDCEIKIEEVDTTFPWAKHFDGVEKTTGQTATLTSGNLVVKINHEGWMSFWQKSDAPDAVDGLKLLFEEQWRNRDRIDRFCVPTGTNARELKSNAGRLGFGSNFSWKATVRFEAYDDEKLFGMGQYQDSHLNKKGGFWELAQKNSQASVPFVISSRGYGFLWNNPAIGSANFATNGTTWIAEQTQKIDYWVTCGTPLEIEENYSAVTGRTPMMPDFAMGFWQCKLRYRTQDEVIAVAKEYKKRGLPIDVIVIDFFHWTFQGDFKFDPKDWPDPEAMVKELSEMNIKVMVSVWPTVDLRSENFEHMAENGLLIGFDEKDGIHADWLGKTIYYDTTNPEAQKFVWERCKENYFKKGINLFWLDEAEPEYWQYQFEHYKYHAGPAMECSNLYPKCYVKGFYDGLKAEGVELPLSLIRCAWAGSQKYGVVVWSGDIHSDFRSFKNQVQAGLSMGVAGIPWWTTDIGGFIGGDIKDEGFRELVIRWFEWGLYCPVMRLHGERPPFKVLEEPYHEINGHQVKQMESGQDNEVWSFGDDAYKILSELLKKREAMKPYIKQVMKSSSENGSPVMRPLFFDFPKDKKSWEIEDEYMFGTELLVCPVTDMGVRERPVYLPPLENGVWEDIATGKTFDGGQEIIADAPLERIPVFKISLPQK